MSLAPDPHPSDNARLAQAFGELALTMLHDTPLSDAWRVNFLANMFVGPIYQEMDARYGLSRPEFVVLFTLSQRPGVVARDICLVTGLPKNSISRAVVSLVERDLIDRQQRDDDRRSKRLALTDAGSALLGKVLPMVEGRQAAMRAALTSSERAVFDTLLMKLIGGIPDWVSGDGVTAPKQP